MGDDSTFFGKTFYMLCFTTEERFWNKQREIGVLYSGFFEHLIKSALHLFPYCIAIRLDNHATAHSSLFSQVSLDYQIIIPL